MYCSTAQKPGVITHSLVGNFTGPDELNLITSKITQIEIHSIGEEGITPLLEVGVYGRIESLRLFRPKDQDQDWIFLTTERKMFSILFFDKKNGQIVTKANGDIRDRGARDSDTGRTAILDPDLRCIGLFIYDGIFKIIPMDPQNGKLSEAYNVRLDQIDILNIEFLYNAPEPTIAILYQDTNEERHIWVKRIDMKSQKLEDLWNQPKCDSGSSFIIPIPFKKNPNFKNESFIVVGESSLTWLNGKSFASINTPNLTLFKAWTMIDENRYLLGDAFGQIYLLQLETTNNNNSPIKMRLVILGETNIPSTLSYLDNGVVFLGSRTGDSQLLKLSTNEKSESEIEILDNFSNIGPIVDCAVVDLERHGQCQLVTCSGAFKDGSLRIIRNGVGIQENANVDLPGIKGLWSLKPNSQAKYDQYIVFSFVGETRVLSMTGEELEETEIPGFAANESTLICGNFIYNQFIQITNNGIYLVDCNSLNQVFKWTPPQNIKITSASVNNESGQILLGIGSTLYYLEVENNIVKEIRNIKLEHDISCVNINPLAGQTKSFLCAIGMWTDISARIYTLPDFKLLSKEILGNEIIPRSILLISFEGIHYLFVALGDGNFFSFTVDPNSTQLSNRKKVSLGTQPLTLSIFNHNQGQHVFAGSDRPTVIYSHNKKLLFSNVNLKEVNFVCSFHSESFENSLALSTNDQLTIGTIDDIQKLHIRTIPLHEMPRRISYDEENKLFLVLTIRTTDFVDQGWLRLYDSETFELLDSFKLGKDEDPISAQCFIKNSSEKSEITNNNNNNEDEKNVGSRYFVVGTALNIPNEPEPARGRLIVFSVTNNSKLNLVTQTTTKGAVYRIASFNGKILAGVNSKLALYDFDESEKKLSLVCQHSGYVLILFIDVRGDFILVGDLMSSLTLLLFNKVDSKIEEIARDPISRWMTSTCMLDDDNYIGTDSAYNCVLLQRNSDSSTEEARSRLILNGQYHLGDFVNRIQPGSFVMKLPESPYSDIQSLIYVTVSGSIGIMLPLPKEDIDFFSQLQTQLTKSIKGVGGLQHENWRSFTNDHKTENAFNFIDGDIVERCLDLPSRNLDELAKSFKMTPEDLLKKVENLQRALH